ncbi:MAG: dipeptide ABC transporter ATP-binding protein [Candidatus Bathyarchaeota archaeon]|nr:dipeptide ABC transporter ATP-binding protein [Candidatus Bathyarchaeota archaeon]MDH5746147.1 dipeptide ABC transporter ATP-binding protein [Candidatus Bathyarchaeota archaeon]
MSERMLEVRNLKKYYQLKAGIFKKQVGFVHAVDGISFNVKKGETLGLVGESGCGKTTAGLTILRLIEPTAGEVFFEGKDIFKATKKEMRTFRRELQIIFQDPYSSLNPRMTVYDIVSEPLKVHGLARKKNEKTEKVSQLIKKAGLSPHEHMHRYPHEFSGGQRQRIGIARALATNPKLIIADEPVSSIDVSVRAQILNLLQDLKKEFRLTMLFISHDLSVVKHVCNRVAVMYVGKIVEIAKTKDLYNNPQHPYSEVLLSAIPVPNPKIRRKRILLRGEVPTPVNPPLGCRFHPRCSYAEPACEKVEPKLINIGGPDEHLVACHLRK